MTAEEVADVRDRRVQRTGVTYGNMRAKLSDYIGQVFECKADSPHYSRKVVRARGRSATRGTGETGESSRSEVQDFQNFEPGTSNIESRFSRQSRSSRLSKASARAFLDIAYPIT